MLGGNALKAWPRDVPVPGLILAERGVVGRTQSLDSRPPPQCMEQRGAQHWPPGASPAKWRRRKKYRNKDLVDMPIGEQNSTDGSIIQSL